MIKNYTLTRLSPKICLLTALLLFVISSVYANPDSCQTITNIQATPGTTSQNNYHVIQLTWDAVSGAIAYEVRYSFNGTTYVNTVEVTQNNYIFEAGYNPDTPYWFEIRIKTEDNSCDWTNLGEPRYTNANIPADIILTATANTIELQIPNESPISNPAHTTYSVYCTTNNLYVQADGSFAETEVFLTRSEWNTTTIHDVTENETYCFYTTAKNQDGMVSFQTGDIILPAEEFNQNFLVHGTSGSTTSWFAPNYNTPISWTNNGPCGSGAIGFNGNWNNFWGNFVRLPQQDATGLDAITLAFTLSNSYVANATNSYFRFYIWADNGYKQVVSKVAINGTEISTNNYGTFYFNEPRECDNVEVTFNLETINNKSDILIYLEANSYYNNSNPFWFYFDDITVTDSAVADVCVTTTLSIDSFENTIGLYPVPVKDVLNIETTENIQNLAIYSLTGQEVMRAENTNNIHVSTLANGIYMARITLGNETVIYKKFAKE